MIVINKTARALNLYLKTINDLYKDRPMALKKKKSHLIINSIPKNLEEAEVWSIDVILDDMFGGLTHV